MKLQVGDVIRLKTFLELLNDGFTISENSSSIIVKKHDSKLNEHVVKQMLPVLGEVCTITKISESGLRFFVKNEDFDKEYVFTESMVKVVVEKVKPKLRIKEGQIYVCKHGNYIGEYLVSIVDYNSELDECLYSLINLQYGNRFNNPTTKDDLATQIIDSHMELVKNARAVVKY